MPNCAPTKKQVMKGIISIFINARAVTLADLVPRLRQCGVEIFLQQMRSQRDQLRSILRDSSAGLGQLSGDNLLPPAAERSIRQVLHQLNHLRNVWCNVLPINIYKKASLIYENEKFRIRLFDFTLFR